jgi:hypothetical protein
MVSEPCEEKAKVVDVVKITNLGVDIFEDAESVDD